VVDGCTVDDGWRVADGAGGFLSHASYALCYATLEMRGCSFDLRSINVSVLRSISYGTDSFDLRRASMAHPARAFPTSHLVHLSMLWYRDV